jgi:EAL domain-containing protein (putative c-di-GMP-specific phosphodiesterase class I)/GGDEF domain-containing protein
MREGKRMSNTIAEQLRSVRTWLGKTLTSAMCVAMLPAVSLGLFWFGGEVALIGAAIAFPAIFVLIGAPVSVSTDGLARGAMAGNMPRDGFVEIVRQYFREARELGLKSAIFRIEIDDHDTLVERYGRTTAEKIAEKTCARLLSVLRENDAVSQTEDFGFSICLAPAQTLDLEACIQLSGRMQAILEEPIPTDGATIYLTGCVGFCQNTRMLTRDSDAWLKAGDQALIEAKHNGPNAIRAYSEEMRKRTETRAELREEVARALDRGQIQPWFQPQISTDTGLVTGFEALARWNHPNRGMVPPSAFLPAIEQAGMLERLAEVMMYHAFTALKAWDNAGVAVPQVGVNFAGPELSNPRLVEKVKWELDRFELAPERLAVEVLETVVANAPNDTITRNINGLNDLGCRIDLDDFGTGHASIASIRRFSVDRIKIDRSFVIKADRDPEQQRMISAILTMAERLEVETLAEGVETVGEHALLAQLGCNHVQGFGIGKPMPFDQTLDWITQHNAKLQATPKIIGNRST